MTNNLAGVALLSSIFLANSGIVVAQAQCATTVECAQAALEVAKQARDSLEAIEHRLATPPRLSCEAISTESKFERFPTVEAKITESLSKGNYTLVSGGCELAGPEPGAAGARIHNGPITASRPNDAKDGWYCRAMDPPGIPLAYSVRAWAVFCRMTPNQ